MLVGHTLIVEVSLYSAALSARAVRGLDGDRGHPQAAKGRAGLRIRAGIAHARGGLRRRPFNARAKVCQVP